MIAKPIRIWFGVALMMWTLNATVQWLARAPLGHDEAQYAIAASEWLAGLTPRWNYLSIGMNVIAAPGVLLGGDERALRLVAVLCGLAFVLASVHLARRVTSAATAAWLAVVIAATICIARRSAELLSDLPAATCLLAATAIAVTECGRSEGPRWRLTLAAPWLAASFYLRYGSSIPIAVIALVVCAASWRAIARRPAPVAATAAVGLLLLVPHLQASIALTGSALGIMHESSATISTEFGSGLMEYVSSNPWTYYGTLATPLLLLGLTSIVRLRDRRLIMLWCIAVGDIVAVGLTTIGQSRYIFVGIVLLLLLGIHEVQRWLAHRPQPLRHRLAIVAGMVVAAAWALVVISCTKTAPRRRVKMQSTFAAVAAITRDARGQPCAVVGRHTTQLEWYSGCRCSNTVSDPVISDRRVYVVIQPGPYQPALAQLPGAHQLILDQPGVVTVTRVNPGAVAR